MALPSNFDEQAYLQARPDVAKAVQNGLLKSGADHYAMQGFQENNSDYDNLIKAKSQAQQPTTQQPDIQGMIVQQMQQALAAKQAALQKVRDEAVNGYQQRISGLQGQYQPLREQSDVGYAQNNRGLQERLANDGIYSSGEAVTNNLQLKVGNENNKNAINLQQTNEQNQLQNAIQQANNNYNYDYAGTVADSEAQRLNALINQSNQDRSFNYNTGRDTILDNRYNQQYQDQRGDVLYNRNYQQGRDAVGDNQWNQQFDYTKANADRDYALQVQAAQQSAARASSGGGSSVSKSSNSVASNKQPYANDNQKNIYDFYNDNKVSYGEKLDTLAQVSQDKGYSQEDRDYADRMKQALRAAQYYDAAYANYRGNY